ncbi:MAG: hypothetical protein HS117_21590 [Verrucomicrobiaceae bacterium]|nr:hypothetical protein [Verrucomicrobiaceae bacterium]
MKTCSLLTLAVSVTLLTGCLTIPVPAGPPPAADFGPAPGGFTADSGPLVSASDRGEFMRVHNEARAAVGAPPLAWSDELAAFAQEWADELARRDRLQHRSGHGHGENLAYGTGVNAATAARMWLEERADYDGGVISTSNFSRVGHYTQMIWSSTTEVGYGIARIGRNTYVVANYAPAGNVIGQRP